MTNEEKQLLLKDLCARLPYGVKVENTSFSEPQIHTLFGRVSDDEFLMLETYKSVGGEDYRRVTDDVHYTGYLENIKPYLRPMSSMTKEEKGELNKKFHNIGYFFTQEPPYDYGLMVQHSDMDSIIVSEFSEVYDWLNKKGFDYRWLIPIGLALEAKEGMYKV